MAVTFVQQFAHQAWREALLFDARYLFTPGMPRQAPHEDVSALQARRAALGASLQEGYARLRKESKAACKRQSRELAARKKTFVLHLSSSLCMAQTTVGCLRSCDSMA